MKVLLPKYRLPYYPVGRLRADGLVTGGGTREPIDPVRFIGNRSSGKMGIAMADAAYARGADVTLVSTVEFDRPYPVVHVETAFEMQEAVEAEFDNCDALVMTAAVADFRPIAVFVTQNQKNRVGRLVLEFTKNPDILDLLVASSAKIKSLLALPPNPKSF